VPRLVPIRYARMLQSPFAFFRGAAAVMAEDLARTPRTGLRVQACGDAHLLNFGVFATPERRRIFDINDFDETLPAPWEWDLKRLAASLAIAGLHLRFPTRDARAAAAASARSYRQNMAAYAEEPSLDAWYARIDALPELIEDPELRAEYARALRREKRRDESREHHDLVHHAGRKPRIKSERPLVYHPGPGDDARFGANIAAALRRYRDSLPDERRPLLDKFELCDVAMKVVGVGSVGTVCAVALYLDRNENPLYLQVKEARASVLEPFAGESRYDNRGQRVVVGQRLMQAASDVFLGWTRGDRGRHFYVRQLRDWKLKPALELMRPHNLERYGELCGWALARAHARTADPALLSGYMGRNASFDAAIARFALAYARQNESDYGEFLEAARTRRIESR
jgi:uncharacterized protein (DUF2252 family)